MVLSVDSIHTSPNSALKNTNNPVQNNMPYPKSMPVYKNTNKNTLNTQNSVNTTLTKDEQKKYIELLQYLKDVPVSENADNLSCTQQLDILLKNGKLLAKSNNDNSTTLDNLYKIATVERTQGINPKNLISNALDILVNPRIITQTFGDIPDVEKANIINTLPDSDEVKKNPSLMDVDASGTCAAASVEVNLADKYPAEFVRWLEGLSGKDRAVYLNTRLDSLSKNKLEALTIMNLLKAQKSNFNFNDVKIKINADDNAYYRTYIQGKYWDKGERNVADVLIQSAVMNTGSQLTYNSLTDVRAGDFNSNPQGLIEIEKTFVESLIKNKEITSLVYQDIDEDQNLIGYNCPLEKIEKHIIDTLNQGDDVILGYVLTNETSGIASSKLYDEKKDGAPNKIINGHEITVVDYKKDSNGKTTFVCIDTDDDNPQFVEYSADWLLPKIHHAGYPAHIVEADEKEIMKNVA